MSNQKTLHHHTVKSISAKNNKTSAESFASAKQQINGEEQSNLIQIRAYGLWEAGGRPAGEEAKDRFWNEAEKEIVASHTTHE
jgi:hypothetical protein